MHVYWLNNVYQVILYCTQHIFFIHRIARSYGDVYVLGCFNIVLHEDESYAYVNRSWMWVGCTSKRLVTRHDLKSFYRVNECICIDWCPPSSKIIGLATSTYESSSRIPRPDNQRKFLNIETRTHIAVIASAVANSENT